MTFDSNEYRHEGGCGTVHANSTADIPARRRPWRRSAGSLGRHYARSWRQPWMRSSM